MFTADKVAHTTERLRTRIAVSGAARQQESGFAGNTPGQAAWGSSGRCLVCLLNSLELRGVEHSLTDFKHMVTRIDLYFRKFTLAAAEKIKQFGRKDLRKGNWRWVISYRLAEKMIRA